MKTRTLLLFIILSISIQSRCEAYDISSLLMDRRYVEKQISCVLNRGYCDFMGKQLRGLFFEVLNNNCRQCPPSKVQQAQKLVEFMQRYYPNEWIAMVQLYRPPPYQQLPALVDNKS